MSPLSMLLVFVFTKIGDSLPNGVCHDVGSLSLWINVAERSENSICRDGTGRTSTVEYGQCFPAPVWRGNQHTVHNEPRDQFPQILLTFCIVPFQLKKAAAFDGQGRVTVFIEFKESRRGTQSAVRRKTCAHRMLRTWVKLNTGTPPLSAASYQNLPSEGYSA
ncbi:hypothetical protein BDW22DRAFT_149533 [Trametopsis cervina]|nr:hypothetical protein BDW22DRAFT_149533 [Trametopsis cervina]